MSRSPALWITDWSDEEDADARTAWSEAGLATRVVRVPPLGPSVGTSWHRMRSYPSYAWLAVAGLSRAGGGPLVAWQPLAGVLAALLRPSRRTAYPLLLVNPLLRASGSGIAQSLLRNGVARSDRVLLSSRAGVEAAVSMGLPRERLAFVRLGVRARRQRPAPPGAHLLAVGREGRDWETLARAARLAGVEVRVIGPAPGDCFDLPLIPQVPRARLFDLMESAAGVVVPLRRPDVSAGQLAILDAFAVGRGVVATRAQGTEDYVDEDCGELVHPGDARGLSEALQRLAQPAHAARLASAALAAAQGPLSLTTFVRRVDAEITAVQAGAHCQPGVDLA